MTVVESTTSSPPARVPGAGAAIVAVAAGLLSLNRFGGLAPTAPRAFVRLALVVVWGWIALAVATWLLSAVVARRAPDVRRLVPTLDAVGRAHLSLTAGSVVLFVAAGALQLRWPGLIAAVVVLGWFFPAALVRAALDVAPNPDLAASFAPLAAYATWLALVGRHLADQLGHLI